GIKRGDGASLIRNRNGKAYLAGTYSYPALTRLEEKWYSDLERLVEEREDHPEIDRIREKMDAGFNRIKRVPEDLEIRPRTLLYAHAGDGHLSQDRDGGIYAYFSCEG
ncbi:MAG: hypothetical protein SVS85_03495, partial [Candidatus Nanohaloarchaea archaeon]|nr:hypothetical protein [Candidatus Nanohaloarchaea archaeon]